MRVWAEVLVLAAGLFVLALGVVQAARDRPSEWWVWGTGLALIAFGLFRQQLRHMKFGPSGIELAVAAALETPAAQLTSRDAPGRPNVAHLFRHPGGWGGTEDWYRPHRPGSQL